MSLKVIVPSTEHIRFGANFDKLPMFGWNGSKTNYCGWYDGPTPGPYECHFLHDWVGQMEIVSPYLDPAKVFGLTPLDGSGQSIIEYLGFPVLPNDRGISSNARRSSAIVHNTRALFTGQMDKPDAFVSDSIGSKKGENTCSHANIYGSLKAGDNELCHRPWEYGVHDLGSSGYTKPKDYITFSRIGGALSYTPSHDAEFVYGWAGDWRGPRMYAHLSTDILFNYIDDPYATPEPLHQGSVSSNLVITLADFDQVASVEFVHDAYDVDFTYWYHSKWLIRVDYQWIILPYTPPSLGVATFIGNYVTCRCTLTTHNYYRARYLKSNGQVSYLSPQSDISWTVDRSPYLIQDSPILNGISYNGTDSKLLATDPATAVVTNESYRLLRQFDNQMTLNGHRLFPGAIKAANDALEDHIGQLEADHLENLSQLQSLKSMITPLLDLGKLAVKVKSGDPVGSAIATIDLLADAQLLWSYGIAPSISDAEEISTLARQTLSKYRDRTIFDSKIRYGAFDFEIPDDFHPTFSGLEGTFRAKLAVKLHPGSVLSAVLPVKAFGLFPTLANLWDLLPFSFVADWKFGIGDKLGDIDNFATFLAFDVEYCVVSMRIHWPIPHDLLESRSLQISGTVDPHLTYYVRSVLPSVPAMTYTDVDFNPGHGLPNWKTVSSLVWSLVT